MKSSFVENCDTYRRVGDYNISNLTLPPQEANFTLGKLEMLHKDYHVKHMILQFNIILIKCTPCLYLANVARQATETYGLLIEQIKKLKA